MERKKEVFQYVADISDDQVIILDSKYNIEYVNDSCCKIFGYNRKDIIGKNFFKLETLNGKKNLKDILQKLDLGNPLTTSQEEVLVNHETRQIIRKVRAYFNENEEVEYYITQVSQEINLYKSSKIFNC